VELARRGHDDSQLSRKQKASEHGQTGGGVPDVRTNNDIAVVAGDRARTSSVGGPERRNRAFVSRISPPPENYHHGHLPSVVVRFGGWGLAAKVNC